MRKFIQRALNKLSKLDQEQIRALLYDLASENETLEMVLNSMTDGVLVTDLEHKIIFTNQGVHTLLPMLRSEPEEHLLWEAVADKEIASFLKESVKKNSQREEEEFTLDGSGPDRTLSFSVVPVNRDDEPHGNLILVSDITDRRKREARLRRAESLASLTTLAAGVAHEIKNPLGSIGIHIQLIQKALKQKQCLDEETAGRYLEIITEEIERLNGIVVDFLFAVRPMDTSMKRSTVNGVVEELIEFIKYELEENQVKLDTKLQRNLPKVDLDEKYMKQALINIIKNGVAAMNQGGTLKIVTREDQGFVHIDISDSGIGMSEEQLSKIFEPYYTTKEFGSGLGLTVVYKVVREHNGEVSVHSRENQGTTFTISLPIPDSEKRLLDWKGEEE
ncbi:MAG: PAS domain S-box protein [Spirochaetaceae bacterium]|nr:PAS domain S-box protein [Spirochaetaceae bacterium]MCF7947532.1 PAS domain S-box protein [Spirochaetia bacterium]MCF7951415.1 PAS domain S-box protein [Spirochaetaceae bacterium]